MHVKRLRKKQGLSQAALAFKAKLSPGYVARLEVGRHDPTLTTMKKLAKALAVPVSELLE